MILEEHLPVGKHDDETAVCLAFWEMALRQRVPEDREDNPTRASVVRDPLFDRRDIGGPSGEMPSSRCHAASLPSGHG